MLDRIRADVRAALENDPAATSVLEVLLLYQGVHALVAHRIAHALHERGFRLTARFVSQVSRFLTGIEIHPGATVGEGVFIDHGMGTVVGETAEVGDDVVMYHGVTLGGTSSERGKRHPTVEDGVMLGAQSTVLGPITVGANAKVGAGAVVVEPVEEGETVVGVPAEPVETDDEEDCEELAAFERRAMGLGPEADSGTEVAANSES